MHRQGRRPRHALGACALVLGLAAVWGTGPPPGAAQSPEPVAICREGESADEDTFNDHGWYARDGVRVDLLSPGIPGVGGHPGDWLAHYSPAGQEAEATYRLALPHDGTYRLWIRGSVYQVRQWLSVDGGPRTALDLASDPRERVNVLEPGRIDIRFLAWVDAGTFDLGAGSHELRFGLERHPERQPDEIHGAIDVLCLAEPGWAPSGAPGTPKPDPGPGVWFPFVPDDDPLDPASITDLRDRLHRPAGAHGPVRAEAAGLAFADGTRTRFWGVNAQPPATPELMARQAAFLAKHGVNLVRLHPVQAVVGLLSPGEDGALGLDEARLDRLDRWFAALKAEGIYSAWSPVYPHVITPHDGYPADLYAELPDRGAGKSSSGMVGFVRELQDAEWRWLRAVLDHENPYTGLRYADDPALAIVETHNEDSVFWHAPLNDLAAGTRFPLHTAVLKRGWASWLRDRYADDGALLAAWGPVGTGSRPGDGLANDAMAIYGAWEMEADGPHFVKAERRRMGDFIRYLAETQRAYYARRDAELRSVGYAGVTVSTAWQAGGPAADAANLWTDTAAEAIDRHAYVGGGAGGHGIAPGSVDTFTHLSEPGRGLLAVGFQQAEDWPFFLSEWNANAPTQWRAEAIPLVALYGMGLGGWDAAMHFTLGDAVRMGGGWPELRTYVTETPLVMGQFPALALAVHRGDIAEGDIVAARRIGLADVFSGRDAFTQPIAGLDYVPPLPGGGLAAPWEALAMGRVTAALADGLPASTRADWDALRDPRTGTVASTTGELSWDPARRHVLVRSPRTAGVVGFAAGTPIDLGMAVVDLRTPYASLLFTSLDDRPLVESRHVLLTALARDRQTGAAYSDAGDRLLDLGGPPLLLEPVQASIAWRGRPIASVKPVDPYGVPREAELSVAAGSFAIDGTHTAYLYEIVTAGEDTPTPPTERPAPAYLPLGLRAAQPALPHPDPALGADIWAAADALLAEHPLASSFPGYASPGPADRERAVADNVRAACHDFPDLPEVFGEGVHRRSCDFAVASYLGNYHAVASRHRDAAENLAWAAAYLDRAVAEAAAFVYGPENAPGGGFRDSFAAAWQNPLRAADLVVLSEQLRREAALTRGRARDVAEVTAAIARAWRAAFWETGVHPSHGVTLTLRTPPDVEARSPAGRDVACRVPWAIAWDADDRNSPAEETAWMGAGAMLSARALGDGLPDADALARAGRHYVDYALSYDRPDALHGGVVRTLSRGGGGTYGQRRYWLKNHAADAPAIPYVGATWHFIGTALMASPLGGQQPWPELVPDGAQWSVMLAATEESLRSADGSMLVDWSPGGGIGFALEPYPDWRTACGQSGDGRAYTAFPDVATGRDLFVSEIGHAAGLDLLSAGWVVRRLAASRGDAATYELWSARMDRILEEYTARPPDPEWARCKFAPYVSANPAYHLARHLSAYATAHLGASGFEVAPWPTELWTTP